jgi:hypothetical protein
MSQNNVSERDKASGLFFSKHYIHTPATAEEAASECAMHDIFQSTDGRYLDDNVAIFTTQIMPCTLSPV